METNWHKSTTRTDKRLQYSNGGHCGFPPNISRTSNSNKLLSTYLFCICGPFLFHLWLLIHNKKLAHRNANNKINLNNPSDNRTQHVQTGNEKVDACAYVLPRCYANRRANGANANQCQSAFSSLEAALLLVSTKKSRRGRRRGRRRSSTGSSTIVDGSSTVVGPVVVISWC